MITVVRVCQATVATTVKLTSMSAHPAPVVTGRGAWTESPATPALAYQATLATTAKQTQMNAVLLHASTEAFVKRSSQAICVPAQLDSTARIARFHQTTVLRNPVSMAQHAQTG